MEEYRVCWEIEVSAASPRDAAAFARDIQRDPQAYAGAFTVIDPAGTVTNLDLDAADNDATTGHSHDEETISYSH